MKCSQTKGTVKIRLFIYLSSTVARLKQVTESMLVLKIQKLCFFLFLIVHFLASGPCALTRSQDSNKEHTDAAGLRTNI